MKPFRWQGRRIRTNQDLVDALAALETPERAAKFRELYTGAIGDEHTATRSLGYVTGYMPRDAGERARALLDIEHPVIGDFENITDRELLQLGMWAGGRMAEGYGIEAAVQYARERLRAQRRDGGE